MSMGKWYVKPVGVPGLWKRYKPYVEIYGRMYKFNGTREKEKDAANQAQGMLELMRGMTEITPAFLSQMRWTREK